MNFDLIISLLTLTFMEVILGIDNIIFISISTDKLPARQQPRARTIGIALALIMRVLLLLAIAWIVGLTQPIASIALPEWVREVPYTLSWRDIILFSGGLFLLAKSTTEIHGKIEGKNHSQKAGKTSSFASVIVQIVLLDVVFSFDSILTAIGLIELPAGVVHPIEIMQHLQFWVMVAAVAIAMVIMLAAASRVAGFINKHPTIKVLALSFLLLIGFMLVLEGLGLEVPKGYIYFAIFFSLFVELINLRVRKKDRESEAATSS
jgi:predicted tellurium resistance membrane protein TerC